MKTVYARDFSNESGVYNFSHMTCHPSSKFNSKHKVNTVCHPAIRNFLYILIFVIILVDTRNLRIVFAHILLR